MSKWEMVKFTDCFSDITSQLKKIPKEKYLPAGKYAIIDQGQKRIAGYSDNEIELFCDVPVVIFGDHTRILKYVDFPLFIGADGVKVLKPKLQNSYCKYLYYALLNVRIIDTGYNRHFKWLKESVIPLPTIEEQKKIAAELDKISDLIAKRKEQIEKLDLLVKAKFIEMFGDPVTNPMGWEVQLLEQFINFLTSGSRGWAKYFSKEGEMFLTIKNVKNNKISTGNIQFIEAPDNKEAYRTKVQENDLLISITADLGRTGVVDKMIAEHGAYINQHLSLIRLDVSRINPCYVSCFLETEGGKNQFKSKNQSAVKAGLNFDAIKSLNIVCPPLDIQNQFVAYVQQVEGNKIKLQAGLAQLELLYKQRMQYYFE